MAIGGGLVVLAAAGAWVVHRLADGGRVTEVGVAEAVERYREQVGGATATSPPPMATPAVPASSATVAPTAPLGTATATTPAAPTPPPSLPPAGVYTYVTEGYDAVDVLGGARHEYPAVTTLTITPEGCGVRLRWDVAVERWDTWDWCLEGGGIRLVASTAYHEFFGVAGRNDYACDGDPRPLDAPVGAAWTLVCRQGDTDTSTMHGRVLERGAVDVDGVAVPALRIRHEVVVEGASTGTQTIEGWYRRSDGLPLQEEVTVDTRSRTAVGVATFAERSSIELASLTPAA